MHPRVILNPKLIRLIHLRQELTKYADLNGGVHIPLVLVEITREAPHYSTVGTHISL